MPAENTSQSPNAVPAIADATLIACSPSVLTAKVACEIVMMSIEQARYFGLDDIGSDIWHRIEAPCFVAKLIHQLAADYEAEVQALLGRMVAQDVVRLA